jgi:hypothetical protein
MSFYAQAIHVPKADFDAIYIYIYMLLQLAKFLALQFSLCSGKQKLERVFYLHPVQMTANSGYVKILKQRSVVKSFVTRYLQG